MGWWIGLGLIAWVVVSIAVAILIGRVVRRATLEDEPRTPSTPQIVRRDDPDRPAA